MRRLLVIAALMGGMAGLWLIDTGVLAGSGELCNSWSCTPAFRVFHIGLYLTAGCLGALAIAALERNG